mmetsp:Transcript_14591/g.25626  ORF Transcript_14591/g.25626 Transcript_14591/m.25626 type:complete len:184 (-) Transcript_14591:143-694(-)
MAKRIERGEDSERTPKGGGYYYDGGKECFTPSYYYHPLSPVQLMARVPLPEGQETCTAGGAALLSPAPSGEFRSPYPPPQDQIREGREGSDAGDGSVERERQTEKAHRTPVLLPYTSPFGTPKRSPAERAAQIALALRMEMSPRNGRPGDGDAYGDRSEEIQLALDPKLITNSIAILTGVEDG